MEERRQVTREDRARTEEERIEPSGEHPAPDSSELGPAPADHQPKTAEASQPSMEGIATAAANDSSFPHAREEGEGTRLLALLLDTDLFFSVKVTDTLKHIGYTTKTHRRLEDFAVALASEDPTLALVNTGGRGAQRHRRRRRRERSRYRFRLACRPRHPARGARPRRHQRHR
jgi:hypothetical protein